MNGAKNLGRSPPTQNLNDFQTTLSLFYMNRGKNPKRSPPRQKLNDFGKTLSNSYMNGAKYPRLSPPKGSIYSLHDCKSFFWGKDSVDIFEKHEICEKTHLCDASSSSTVSQKQKRAFVFKLFLCNPFARSAGIFYALLRAFTRF